MHGGPRSEERREAAAGRIFTPERNVWRQARAEDSGVIVDAAEYYEVFYRAAERAKRYIIISGWQFDRGVKLLRGEAARGKEPRLVRFLNGLCHRSQSLEIFILAWDFNVVFALEREWMQRLWFEWATHKRFHFRFDESEAAQSSHHQKFVVIDGVESFLGGIDLCEARWDDRAHSTENPLRVSRKRRQKPYHDLQAHLLGTDVGSALRDLFLDRWKRSGGDALALPTVEGRNRVEGIRLGPATIGLSRTDPRGQNDNIREVEKLHIDAIASAERMIYIETQYFSSRSICQALVDRMRRGGALEIVVMVNERAEALKEEIAVGLRQAKNIERLRRVAASTGHHLGCYYTLSDGEGEHQRATYLHSKTMVVDDRFLTVGSANLTNRSMGVDSELHASWEADEGSELSRRIRRVRVSLLAEHAGRKGPAQVRPLVSCLGLVERLDRIAGENGRLRAHGPPSEGQKRAMRLVDPQKLPFDPAEPTYDVDGDDDFDDEPNEPSDRSTAAFTSS
jgi:phosphatidylserine/phosphatidylglycerophosphate/cardiolipin synthase-like enzyme